MKYSICGSWEFTEQWSEELREPLNKWSSAEQRVF